MQFVNKEIYARLSNILNDIKVPSYPAIADEDAKLPYVVYNNNSYTVNRTKDGIESYDMQYNISVYADKFDTADQIADLIRKGLDGIRSKTIYRLWLNSGSSSFTDGVFVQDLNFDIECDATRGSNI